MPESPSKDYILDLIRKSGSANRTVAFRATAELEDINDGHWDGQRYDDPPESWWHPDGGYTRTTPRAAPNRGIADVDSGEPIILVMHLAEKQGKGPLTRYRSESGAFKFSVDWDYVLVSKLDQPGRTRHLHVPEHIELYVKEV